MTTNDIERLLRQLAAIEEATDPVLPPAWPGPGCVPTARLVSIYTFGDAASDSEQAHIAECPYCGRAARRLDNVQQVDAVWSDLIPDEPTVPSEVFARLNVRVQPRVTYTFRSGSGNSPTPAPTQMPLDITPDGPPAALREVTERYFSPFRDVPKFTLVLSATDGGHRPAVQMSPAPNRGEPARLGLTFPDGTVREFVIPSGPPRSTASAISAPGEVLPASVLDSLTGGWHGTLEIR